MLHNLAVNWEHREEEKSSFTDKGEGRNHSWAPVKRIDKVYLIRLLYDGAIDAVIRAQNASHRGDMAGRIRNIDRALNIVSELSRSLRRAEHNEMVGGIGNLYIFWIKSLNRAKHPESGQSLEKIIGMMNSVRAICLPKSAPVLRNIRAI
jgi:flagellar biosynthetic protein FliS